MEDLNFNSIQKTLTQRNLQVHSIPLNVHVNTVHRVQAIMLEHFLSGEQIMWMFVRGSSVARK